MALKFARKTETISFADGDGELTLHGLALPEITVLVDAHKETVSQLFDKFTGRDPNSFTMEDAGSVAMAMVLQFPPIVAHVIALAADATEQFDEVGQLPLDVQVAALEKTALLTFSMAGGPKHFLEMIVRIAKGVSGFVESAKNSQA